MQLAAISIQDTNSSIFANLCPELRTPECRCFAASPLEAGLFLCQQCIAFDQGCALLKEFSIDRNATKPR